jgi:hypothetical protein
MTDFTRTPGPSKIIYGDGAFSLKVVGESNGIALGLWGHRLMTCRGLKGPRYRVGGENAGPPVIAPPWARGWCRRCQPARWAGLRKPGPLAL